MALASTPNDYCSLKLNDDKKSANKKATMSCKDPAITNNLDFYESMYNFKKMFPKFDAEVIETVLRSNDGSVDKTVDQLLAMSMDDECSVIETMFVDLATAEPSAQISENPTAAFSDLPPSYNEFLATKAAETNTSIDKINEKKRDDSVLTNPNRSILQTDTIINYSYEKLTETPNCAQIKPLNNIGSETTLAERKSRILIGELPNSFLRIKLTSEQIKKFKTTIKKAKRNEITAMLNNPTDVQPVSRDIKKKLSILNEQIQPEEQSEDKDWQSKYNSVSKMYESRRIQIIHDEYLAKLMQNEEFLNEIKTDHDFMHTLNQESKFNFNENDQQFPSNRNLKSSEKFELSNAELKSKLNKMGKASRVKLAKLGSAFTRKNQYREAVEQSGATCSNIFTELKANSPIEDDSYYHSYKKIDSKTNYEENPLDLYPSKPSRYQKAYKSFKSVLRRNSTSASSSIPVGLTIKSTNKQRSNLFEDDSSFYERPTLENSLDSNKFVNDLIVFDNDYSYDNNNSNSIQNYDFSTYPYTKTASQNSSKSSRTSKN